MYAIVFSNIVVESICMCFKRQAFCYHFHMCMLCQCVDYNLVCVSVIFYMILTNLLFTTTICHVEEE